MADLVVDRKETRRVITGADGFGLPLQAALVEHLRQKGYEVVDLGVDKYYSVATEVGKRLADEKKQSPDGPLSRGLLVCGTGVGVSIFANKFGGVYAVNCRSIDDAINARSINNSNVITLGSQAVNIYHGTKTVFADERTIEAVTNDHEAMTSVEEGKKILDTWLETPFKAPCPASDGRPWNDEIGQFLDSSIGEMEKISEPALDNNGASLEKAQEGSAQNVLNGSAQDATVPEESSKTTPSPVELLEKMLHLTNLSADLPPAKESNGLEAAARAGVGEGLIPVYAPIASETLFEERAGVGPGLTAIHAPISHLSTVSTIDSTFGSELADETTIDKDILHEQDLNDKELDKGDLNGVGPGQGTHGCAICSLATKREFENVAIMPGGSWRIVREDPTSAVVKFKAGSLEPAHHHTFGHDLIVTSGTKTVWNLSTNEKFDLGPGDFLYTPAGDVHRVQYHEDTEFFIRWDGHWDILLDEDLDTAAAAVKAAHES